MKKKEQVQGKYGKKEKKRGKGTHQYQMLLEEKLSTNEMLLNILLAARSLRRAFSCGEVNPVSA